MITFRTDAPLVCLDDADPDEAYCHLSWSALCLHHSAARNAPAYRHDFVPDAWLVLLDPETAEAVAELATVGLWLRVEAGFRILDPVLIQVADDRRLDEAA